MCAAAVQVQVYVPELTHHCEYVLHIVGTSTDACRLSECKSTMSASASRSTFGRYLTPDAYRLTAYGIIRTMVRDSNDLYSNASTFLDSNGKV